MASGLCPFRCATTPPSPGPSAPPGRSSGMRHVRSQTRPTIAPCRMRSSSSRSPRAPARSPRTSSTNRSASSRRMNTSTACRSGGSGLVVESRVAYASTAGGYKRGSASLAARQSRASHELSSAVSGGFERHFSKEPRGAESAFHRGFRLHSLRRGWDSNPRGACTPSGFQDRPVRPLRHPAAAIVTDARPGSR
jgi:hypothetical protein